MTSNGKMEIQNIVEKLLAKHNIAATKDFYLKLTMPPYMNLVLERNGDIILVGHYREENGDLISDPVLAMEGKEIWAPIRIELWCGDTICAFYEDGKRMIYPDKIKEFRAFQRMFARNIREQKWLENGVRVENV
jgi:hypothetical protein